MRSIFWGCVVVNILYVITDFHIEEYQLEVFYLCVLGVFISLAFYEGIRKRS